MAARILPFRSLIPAIKQAAFAPAPGALFALGGERGSPKVVTMSRSTRSRRAHRKYAVRDDRFAPVEQDLTNGYVEVEITGISWRRLTDIYAVLMRGAWASALGTARSLLRPAPSTDAQTISLANRKFGV